MRLKPTILSGVIILLSFFVIAVTSCAQESKVTHKNQLEITLADSVTLKQAYVETHDVLKNCIVNKRGQQFCLYGAPISPLGTFSMFFSVSGDLDFAYASSDGRLKPHQVLAGYDEDFLRKLPSIGNTPFVFNGKPGLLDNNNSRLCLIDTLKRNIVYQKFKFRNEKQLDYPSLKYPYIKWPIVLTGNLPMQLESGIIVGTSNYFDPKKTEVGVSDFLGSKLAYHPLEGSEKSVNINTDLRFQTFYSKDSVYGNEDDILFEVEGDRIFYINPLLPHIYVTSLKAERSELLVDFSKIFDVSGNYSSKPVGDFSCNNSMRISTFITSMTRLKGLGTAFLLRKPMNKPGSPEMKLLIFSDGGELLLSKDDFPYAMIVNGSGSEDAFWVYYPTEKNFSEMTLYKFEVAHK